MNDEYLLHQLNLWMSHNEADYNKTIYEVRDEWLGFWDTWKEIKARKLEFKKENQLYIGIVGTRSRDSYEDFHICQEAFKKHYTTEKEIVIVSGLCSKGADKFALFIQRNSATKKIWFPAEWDKYGTKAGIIRNTDIAMVSDRLIAMVRPDRKGGTEDTIVKFCAIQGNSNNLFLL